MRFIFAESVILHEDILICTFHFWSTWDMFSLDQLSLISKPILGIFILISSSLFWVIYVSMYEVTLSYQFKYCSGFDFLKNKRSKGLYLIPRSTQPPPTGGHRRGSCRPVSPWVSPGRPWCRGHCRPSCPGPARASSNSALGETGTPRHRSLSTRSSCSPPIWKTGNVLRGVRLCSLKHCSTGLYLGWHSLPMQKSCTGSGRVCASQYISCTSTPS